MGGCLGGWERLTLRGGEESGWVGGWVGKRRTAPPRPPAAPREAFWSSTSCILLVGWCRCVPSCECKKD